MIFLLHVNLPPNNEIRVQCLKSAITVMKKDKEYQSKATTSTTIKVPINGEEVTATQALTTPTVRLVIIISQSNWCQVTLSIRYTVIQTLPPHPASHLPLPLSLYVAYTHTFTHTLMGQVYPYVLL